MNDPVDLVQFTLAKVLLYTIYCGLLSFFINIQILWLAKTFARVVFHIINYRQSTWPDRYGVINAWLPNYLIT